MTEHPRISTSLYYETLSQSQLIGFALLNDEFTYQFTNQKYASFLQVDRQQLIGSNFFECLDLNDANHLRHTIAIQTDSIWKLAPQIITLVRGEQTIELQVEIKSFIEREGAPTKYLIIAKKAEQMAMVYQEAVFKNIFEQSPIGLIIQQYGMALQPNQQFCDMLGYAMETLRMKNMHQLLHPDDIANYHLALEPLRQGVQQHTNLPLRFLSKYGETIMTRTTITCTRFHGDRKDTFLTYVEDVTEQQRMKEHEQELLLLRQKDAKAMEEQQKLKEKMETLNRELSSNLMFISQRNALLESINKSLREISSKASYEVRHELFKISSKVKGNIQLDEAWGKFKMHFDKTHPQFFSKLRDMKAGLTQKEIKQCAYIRIGLSNKEAAQLLGVSPKSIEMARYRIKKKLHLEADDSLTDYINKV